jgi:GT2 family glycosyltransferase
MLFIDDIPFISMLLTSFHPKPSFYRFKHKLDWVTGAFFLTRREIWEDLKGFDEQYFMYMEEVDFCYRARKKWKVLYNPDFSLIHYGGASSKSIFPIVSEFKGLRIFYKKFFPGWQLTILRGVLKLGSVMRIILFSIVKGPKEANVYEEAFIVA